jgi:hypothetical protein
MADPATLAPLPETLPPDPAPAPRRRIILMSGEWRAPASLFIFEATIFVGANGGAEGDFFWVNRDTPHIPPDLVGAEWVRGAAGPARLDLQGYRTDSPWLTCDHYKITLCGAPTAGICSGVTYGHGGWEGRLEGVYRVVEQQE